MLFISKKELVGVVRQIKDSFKRLTNEFQGRLRWSSVEVMVYFFECIEIGTVLHDNRMSKNVDESLFILADLNIDVTSYSNSRFGEL